MSAEIITQELLHRLFEYRDGCLFWRISRTNNVKRETQAGSVHDERGYRRIVIGCKKYYEHRVIFQYFHGSMPRFVDHIDADKMNNRIENLREVTKQQNGFNAKRCSLNTSGFKGVAFDKKRRKWEGCCKVGSERYRILGDDPAEVSRKLELIRERVHGEYANHG